MWRGGREYFVVFAASYLLVCINAVPQKYLQARQHILTKEEHERIGGHINLTLDEQKVNQILMKAKRKEIENARVNGTIFPPAISFFQSKKMIDQSGVFKIIKRMPKGGALHTHDSSIVNLTWVIKNVTYRENCYMCVDNNGDLQMHFYNTPPQSPDCHWRTVKVFRQEYRDADAFDRLLYRNLTIITDNPETVYPTIDAVWNRFGQYFRIINGLYLYAPVFRDYFVEALKEFHADNVQYIEIRALLTSVYELDGTIHSRDWILKLYRDEIANFVRQNPDFIGANVIYSTIRFQSKSELLPDIKDAIRLQKQYPDLFKGFDLVGQEDPGKTLFYYVDDLLYPSRQNPPVNLPYFFHAGETDWQNSQVDDNLVDALLLNTTRIGHGFAIHKHPEIMKMIKEKNIAVEVNPISNQVLMLVGDLRNHAAAALIASNFPIVISSDDPAVWDATPLSHDFYEAFMALSGEDADLTLLKQFAINSIKYSAMTFPEKQAAMRLWQTKWIRFIKDTIIPMSGVAVGK